MDSATTLIGERAGDGGSRADRVAQPPPAAHRRCRPRLLQVGQPGGKTGSGRSTFFRLHYDQLVCKFRCQYQPKIIMMIINSMVQMIRGSAGGSRRFPDADHFRRISRNQRASPPPPPPPPPPPTPGFGEREEGSRRLFPIHFRFTSGLGGGGAEVNREIIGRIRRPSLRRRRRNNWKSLFPVDFRLTSGAQRNSMPEDSMTTPITGMDFTFLEHPTRR